MRVAISAILFVFAAACSQVDPISDEEEVDIDCLASQTVVAITDAIRLGINEGLTADVADVLELLDVHAVHVLAEHGRVDEALAALGAAHLVADLERGV